MNPPHKHDASDDDGRPLTPEENAWVRQARRDEQHASWLRGRIKIFWPWVVSVTGGIVWLIDWLPKHWKSGP